MHEIIKNIISNNYIQKEDKLSFLNDLENDIIVAKDILKGRYTYCDKCDDYYISESFITKEEIIEENVCVYADPINSGGDEYTKMKVKYRNLICPKGCKHTICKKVISY